MSGHSLRIIVAVLSMMGVSALLSVLPVDSGVAASFFSSEQEVTQFGSLSIATHPDGATIHLEDQPVGLSPVVLDQLPVGSYTVRLEKVGYPVRQEVIEIRQGQEAQLHLALLENGPAVVDIRSEPDQSEWWLDGRLIGVTPQRLTKVTPGEHRILVRKPGYNEWAGRFEARAGQLVLLKASLVAKEFHLTVLTDPEWAKVRFLNSRKVYKPGMLMKPGQYVFWITAPGFESKKGRVYLKDRDWIGHVRLEKVALSADHEPKKREVLAKQTLQPLSRSTPPQPQVMTAHPVRSPSAVVNQKEHATSFTDFSIADLLAAARLDVENGRLFNPPGESAAEKYRSVLAKQPNHAEAMAGLKKVKQLSEQGYLGFVRIFPVAERDQAETFLARIKGLGLPGFFLPTFVKGAPYLRACVGLFPNRDAAVAGLARIKGELGVKDAILRRYRPSLHTPKGGGRS
ncbi:MAG: PEGA domain-containing protein [Magnetococcales bacterium]|nr:PEGA domain-containing protein [Magnetococcales bacterium]